MTASTSKDEMKMEPPHARSTSEIGKPKFHALQLAYDVLSDQDRRARYDQTGDTGQQRERDPNEMAIEVLARLVDELTQQIITEDGLEHVDLAKKMRQAAARRRRLRSRTAA